MRILVVDNTFEPKSYGSKELRRFAWEVQGAEIHTRRAPHEDLPKDLSSFDRVILSGSATRADERHPWIEKLETALRYWFERGTPVLGVCFGHQMIARALGGYHHVRRSATPELGWTEITQLAPSRLLKGVPQKFYSFSSHYDEVCELPSGAVRTASSPRCEFQSFEFSDKPFFGIQFHPEKNLEECTGSIDRWKKDKKTNLLMRPNDGKQLFSQIVGATIFGNFFNEI